MEEEKKSSDKSGQKVKKSKKIILKVKEFFKFKWFLKFLGMRQAKYGSNTLLAIVVLLGIIILVNYILQKENIRWDLTQIKQYTLSNQTEKALESIQDEIQVKVFVQESSAQKTEIEDLLEEYRALNDNIKIEFIDPDVKPTIAKQYEVTRYGTIIFEKGGKKEQSLSSSESDITSSILKLTRDIDKSIYFIDGHNEKDIEDESEAGYGIAGSMLEKEGYMVEKLPLYTDKEIPEDAAVLVIAGPKKKLLKDEIDLLDDYIKKGGKVLALVDPTKESTVDVGISGVLKEWGVELKDGVVIDPKKYFWTDVGTPVVDEWESHQITSSLAPSFFPGIQYVGEAEEHPENVEITSLAQTSSSSWLERNIVLQQTKYDEGVDVQGPISIAMVVQGVDLVSEEDLNEEEEGNTDEENQDNPKPRIIVVGDSDFATNVFAESLGNFDFFVNSVDWLAEEEDLISIRPKEDELRTVTLTGGQTKLIFYITVIGMPLIVIILGIGVYLDKKRKRKL